MGCYVKHVDALLVLDPDVGAVLDQELDELDIAMETCEVEGEESFVGLGWSIDPDGHHFPDFSLDVVESFLIQIVWIQVVATSFCLLFPHACRETLLVERDEIL